MLEKFTYFDFLMYVLPGTVLEFALLGVWVAAKLPLPQFTGEGGLFSSIVFVLIAFILGHSVQAIAHTFPEWLIKRLFWGRFYPSEIMFFNNQRILFSKEKETIISKIIAEKIISENDSQLWKQDFVTGWFRPILPVRKRKLSDDLKKGTENSQLAFNRLRIFLTDNNLGKRVEGAESSYQFFRGTYTALAISGIMFISEYYILSRYSSLETNIGHSLLAGSVLAILLALVFVWRARGAGQRYAREVVRAFDTTRTLPPIKTNESPVNS